MVGRTGDHGFAASRRQQTNPFFPNGLDLRSWFNRKTGCMSGPPGMRFLKHIHIDYENNFAGVVVAFRRRRLPVYRTHRG